MLSACNIIDSSIEFILCKINFIFSLKGWKVPLRLKCSISFFSSSSHFLNIWSLKAQADHSVFCYYIQLKSSADGLVDATSCSLICYMSKILASWSMEKLVLPEFFLYATSKKLFFAKKYIVMCQWAFWYLIVRTYFFSNL